MSDSFNRSKSTREVKRLSADMARIGQVLGDRYELLALLGHGGMGAVYKARQLQMERFVAVKMLLADMCDDEFAIGRFFREAKASGKINHPNVVQLIDFGQAPEGEAYIVIEFLDGIGLDQVIKNERQLDAYRAVNIFAQVCDGVAHAHSKGIIHRDLKPSNVMLVTEEGEHDFVKIVDFGLAKGLNPSEESQRLTQTGEVFGSPVYMSPEQCLGQQIDGRSDVYSLGVLMYETLTGKVPILGGNVAETIARQMAEIPKPFAAIRPDLQVPETIEKVVLKALAKSPDERQASMLELKEELLAAIIPSAVMPAHNSLNSYSTMKATTQASPKPTMQEAAKKKNFSRISTLEPAPTAKMSVRLIAMGVAGLVFVIGGGAFLLFNVIQAPVPSAGIQKNASTGDIQNNGSAREIQNTGVTGEKRQPVVTGTAPIKSTPSAAIPLEKAEKNGSTERPVHVPVSAKNNTETPTHIAKSSKNTSASKTPIVATNTIVKKSVKKSQNQSLTHPSSNDETEQVSQSHKHHHDWSDFSTRYERKDSNARMWTVPLAGSKTQAD